MTSEPANDHAKESSSWATAAASFPTVGALRPLGADPPEAAPPASGTPSVRGERYLDVDDSSADDWWAGGAA